MRIEGSVGQNGDNLEDDVRLVQQLLNRQDLSPLKALNENGRVEPPTVTAIRHFQARVVGMQSPDGRVDPDGMTFRYLTRGGTARGKGENTETRQADREERAKFVDSRVKETGVTTKIIDALVPRFGDIRAKIISGYLSDADLFWKVNYHWEYLLQMVDHSLTLPIENDDRKELQNIRSTLLSNQPDPASGYTSSPVGRPEDKSPADEVMRRHRLLLTSKEAFKIIVDSAGLKQKSKKSPQTFDLAAARVAAPGNGKHSTGYAVDIEGDNHAIGNLCKGLGATLVFDEASHVHVEFKNGVAA